MRLLMAVLCELCCVSDDFSQLRANTHGLNGPAALVSEFQQMVLASAMQLLGCKHAAVGCRLVLLAPRPLLRVA
jgi:hypothetical protein